MKKDLNSLIEQALENINKDRQETEVLLDNLKEYMSVSNERYSDSGATAVRLMTAASPMTLSRPNSLVVGPLGIMCRGESMWVKAWTGIPSHVI